MAAGLAVVASDVPACREVLSDGRWGTLAPAGDSGALAHALLSSLARQAFRDSDERRTYLERYSPPRMIAAYVAAAS